MRGGVPHVADNAAAHVDGPSGANAVRLRAGPRHLGDHRRPLWPRLSVIQNLEHLLGGDRQVDGVDEANGASSMKSRPTRLHACMAIHSR